MKLLTHLMAVIATSSVVLLGSAHAGGTMADAMAAGAINGAVNHALGQPAITTRTVVVERPVVVQRPVVTVTSPRVVTTQRVVRKTRYVPVRYDSAHQNQGHHYGHYKKAKAYGYDWDRHDHRDNHRGHGHH